MDKRRNLHSKIREILAKKGKSNVKKNNPQSQNGHTLNMKYAYSRKIIQSKRKKN